MIPIRDINPTHRVPWVTYGLILLNILVFVFQWLLGSAQTEFVYNFALIPSQITDGIGPGDMLDFFSSMFMHAGLAHIGGNMLYLWIFGDNIEDAMGHTRYLLFYLLGGIGAAVVHIMTNPNSVIPTVGASGAIAAVLGAYLVLYPRSRVMTLIFLGYWIRMTVVPSVVVLGLWFVLQLFSGVASLGGPDVGGTAFWAHIGGFVIGVVLAKLFSDDPHYNELERW